MLPIQAALTWEINKIKSVTLKGSINIGFHNKNTIDFELYCSDFNGVFSVKNKNRQIP